MTMLSFQHDAASQYLGKAMNMGVEIPSPATYRDPAAELSQSRKPLPYMAATSTSFGAGSSWVSSHINPHAAYQRGNMKTIADFDTARVNPGAF